jgi:hypothetical protein
VRILVLNGAYCNSGLRKVDRNKMLPKIIWVAARPPIPPFSGPTSKSLCGISALAAATTVDVVTFVDKMERTRIAHEFAEFWSSQTVSSFCVEYGYRSNWIKATLTGRFQFGTMIEHSSLPVVLDDLGWTSPARLVIFDDIVLAPFAARYGTNAILSPHDCMSKMFRSHFLLSPHTLGAARKYLQSLIARRYERKYYHRALLTHVITQRDRIWLEDINPRARYQVVPNSDLLNPGFVDSAPDAWDVMLWGDLRINSIARGVREFLVAALQDRIWLSSIQGIVVGRVPIEQAQRIIGNELLSAVEYLPYLENDQGKLQHAKITVIPDIGGAGTKNRCVNLLASGKCLACLYPQMEGVEKACDRGAINASDLGELVAKVKKSLREDGYRVIAKVGQAIFEGEYTTRLNQRLWVEMVERAIAIRDGM